MKASELRFFSQDPVDVERRKRAYMEAIRPLLGEIARLREEFPRSYVMFIPAGGEPEDLSPPWEEGLPPEVKQHVENVRGHIARTAAEYGFGPELLAQKTVTSHNPR